MDYEKMWKTLKIKLLTSQEKILRKDEYNQKVLRNPRDFMMRIISRILIIMEEIERGEE